MKELLLILCVVFASISCFSQLENTDSLLAELSVARDDTNKVKLLLNIGEQYENTNPETAKNYYRLVLQLSRKIGYPQGEIKYASYYSSALNIQGHFDSSLSVNLTGLQQAKRMKDSLSITKMCFNVANSYSYLNKNDSALYYYFQVLPYLENQNSSRMLAVAYNSLQNTYRKLRQFQKGITYGKASVKICRSIQDSLLLEYGSSSLGTNYASLEIYDTAMACYREALEISSKIGDRYGESATRLNIGDIDFRQGKYEEARKNFAQALQIARELNLSETETIALKSHAMYFLQMKKYTPARQYADSAVAITLRNGDRGERLKIYKLLADISYGNQDLTAANAYNSKYDQLNDSINNDNLAEISTQYEKLYDTQKKESQIKLQEAQLNQKATLNYFLIGGSVALLLISLLGYHNYKSKRILQQARIDELEAEKKLMAAEAVLKGEEQERTRLAKDLHDGLGGMLSGIKHSLNIMKGNLIMTPDNAQAFERSLDMLDGSIKEMRRVAHNMMPEVLVRYGLDTALKEYCREITQSGVMRTTYQSIGMKAVIMEQTTAVAIYRIVQELVNNTIKHASANKMLVQVHVSSQENLLTLTVEDNGRGFDSAVLKNSPGIGWSNILNRVEFLKGKIDVNSSQDKGTSVLIEISL